MYFDRQGQPIDLITWAGLFEDRVYAQVAFDQVGPFRVSTVWLGLNHNYSGGVPLIFETMIFDTRIQVPSIHPGETYDEDVAMWRYPSEVAALAGHDQAVMWAREHAEVSS